MAAPANYFEIIGKDAAKLQDFYRRLFDWEISPNAEMGGYGFVRDSSGEGSMGAVGPTLVPGEPTGVRIYCQVEDPQAILDKVVELGGKVVVPVTTIPDMVTYALYADPEGNVNGIFKG